MTSSDLFLWTDDFNVHIQEIDEQHKRLAGLINQLHIAICESHGKDSERDILDQLAESTRTHFLLEESMMRLTHYYGFEVHKNQHEILLDGMRTLQMQLDSGDVELNKALLPFLKDWLLEHIESCDRNFSTHFKKSGLGQCSSSSKETAQTIPGKKGWWKFW